MIYVSYDPFQINGGSIYRMEDGQVIDHICDIDSTIGTLARAVTKYAYSTNDFDINFKTEFPHDMQEFKNAIDYYELNTFHNNKLTVKEIK